MAVCGVFQGFLRPEWLLSRPSATTGYLAYRLVCVSPCEPTNRAGNHLAGSYFPDRRPVQYPGRPCGGEIDTMNKYSWIVMTWGALMVSGSCRMAEPLESAGPQPEFRYETEQFADIRILRYRIPGFEDLSLRRKKLAYYLYEAGLSGRDIIWDQNYRHNLLVRHTLENIVRTFQGDRATPDWEQFLTYTKRVWFSNGIHHHYSYNKILPEFSPEYFAELLEQSAATGFPTREGESLEAFRKRLEPIIFDPNRDAKKVNKAEGVDKLLTSATNFYGPTVTENAALEFYRRLARPGDPHPPSWGLNSQLTYVDGALTERVWKVGGLYDPAIRRIVEWLEKAAEVAENAKQAEAIRALIEYYRTGDLRAFDRHSILWVEDTASTVDFINGFIEVYNDPLGFKGSYESVVFFTDPVATRRIATLGENAQWFEDHSPIEDQHKKPNVRGISARVVTVVGEAGDSSPSTPIGINLPNANWIRSEHGSKSVNLGNIVYAYNESAKQSGVLEEFAFDEEEIRRAKEFGTLADNLHTDLHEVIGHASGRLEPGVGRPAETLKNYASTLEEARADLVALYFLLDPKLVELGVMPSLEVGKAAYDDYIRNGLLVQLARVKPGENLEEDHMRNRQMVALWAYEHGRDDGVIERVLREGKTYFVIRDYARLRQLFGELLREVQRIKSQGDYEAGRSLVEGYGVQVDPELHEEVLQRWAKLNRAPYAGFINPVLRPVYDEAGEITDVMVEYPDDFLEQMLFYGEKYAFLEVE